jgi:hypothetical protein
VDATPTNFGSNAGNNGRNHGGDDRRSEEGQTRSGGRKDKGKGRMTEAQEQEQEDEREDKARRALVQRREEVMARLAANLAAENERARDAQQHAAKLVQMLSELEELDAADPQFERDFANELVVEFLRSPTEPGPVGDEDEAVSESPSERDPRADYTEDEERERALQ